MTIIELKLSTAIKEAGDIEDIRLMKEDAEYILGLLKKADDALNLLKEQEEQIKNRDESLEKAREEIKWLRGMLKEQETKWIHREDLDFKDKLGCNHFHGMCGNCGFIHDFIDDHTGQYKYCPQCGRMVKWE